MNKSILLTALFGSAIGSQSFAADANRAASKTKSHAPASVSVLRVYDQTAVASFQSWDESGCIETDVVLSGGNDIQWETGQPTIRVNQTGSSLSIFDICNFVPVLVATNGLSDKHKLVIAPDFSSATLDAEVPLVDGTLTAFIAVIHLTFTATGPVQHAVSTSVDTSTPGTRIVNTYVSETRDAIATGTIGVFGSALYPDTTNITTGVSTSALLSKVKMSTTTITKP